jgi:hypothetical protein
VLSFVESLALKEAQQRLDALQRDSFKIDVAEIAAVAPIASVSRKRAHHHQEEDDDDNNNDDDDGVIGRADDNDDNAAAKRRRGRVHLRAVRSLQQLVEEAALDAMPSHVPTCVTALAAPSLLPRRHFCITCGYLAAYTCTRCSQRYCSIVCNQSHLDAKRCR